MQKPLLLLAIAQLNYCPTATVPPALSATPTSLVFPNAIVGSFSAPETVFVTNIGGSTTSSLSVGIGGLNASQFVITSDNCTPLGTLTINSTCTVGVEYQPTTGGANVASLMVTPTPGLVPVAAALNGVSPALDIVPNSFTFPTIVSNADTSKFDFVVTNTGAATTGTLTSAFSGPDSTQFSIFDTNCPTTLTTGENCTVIVQFVPTIPGTKNAFFKMYATPGDTAVLVLSGTGS